ncbi:hypothetical protein ACHAWC_007974 [Mediolabrus comicus]
MHGSGDVLPEHVNPKSVAVLAQLTENYVEKLVRAAMDAHDIFTDGEVVGGGACLGIPPFPSSSYSATAAAAMYDSDNDEDDNDNNNEKVDESEEAITRKRKRAEKEKISKKFKKIDYWDQPLPTAAVGGTAAGGGGIGGEEDSSNGGVDSSVNDDSDSSDDDSDNDDSSSSQKITSSIMRGSGRKQSGFVGTLPIDLHANQRTRDYYVSAPTAMDVRSFIFPICHDAVLYQRVKEMQANRRAIGRDMMDHVLLQAVQEEGENLGRVDVSDMWSSVLNAAAVAAAEAEEAKAAGGSNNVATSDVAGINKAKDGEEKKSVEAGLVDTNVDASWPGMNPLSRGRLW